MKLRHKTSIIVASISIALFALLYIVTQVVVRDGFYTIETDLARKNITRVVTALEEIILNIETKSSDWAKWDDLYDYVEHPTIQFVKSNLHENILKDLNLNFLIIVNSKDSIIYQHQYISETDEHSGIDSELLNLILNTYRLTEHKTIEDVHSGVMHSKQRISLVVSRPILTSGGSGPSRGTLIFGKFFGKQEIDHISSITNVNFKMYPINSSKLPDDIRSALENISPVSPFYIHPLGINTIIGYTLTNDIRDIPQFIVRVSMSREIYKQSNLTIFYLLASFLAISLIYGLLFTFIMEKIVITRTARLNNEVARIGKGNNPSMRVQCSGHDELTKLSESINEMLAAQERSDRQLRIKNNEMNLIMDTIQIGILSLNEQFLVNPVYSQSAEIILGISPLTGASIIDILQIKQPSKLASDLIDYLSLLMISALPDDEMQGLNPCDEHCITINNNIRWIRLDFHKMHRGETDINQILVEIKDITQEKMLIAEINRTERENVTLKTIAEDPYLFKEFLWESLQLLENTQQLIETCETQPHQQYIHDIFRNVHLLKGSSDSFGLINVAEIAGALEDQLSIIRNIETISVEDIQQVQLSVLKLSEALYQAIHDAQHVIGDAIGDQPDITLRISLEKIDSEIGKLSDFTCKRYAIQKCQEIQHQITMHYYNLRLEPVKRGFAKSLHGIPSLIKRLGKNCVFLIEGEELMVDCVLARKLNGPLLHALRNALDHGIETPEERLQTAKPETGVIKCCFSRDPNNSDLIIKISDDGRGIDIDKIRKKAFEKGFFTADNAGDFTDESVLDILFKPGFTTLNQASAISGRGVGLDTVLTVIKGDLGGSIDIVTSVNTGTTFTFTIPDSAIHT